MSDVVTFTKHGNVGIISINNPPVNALSRGVRAGLKECVAKGIAQTGIAAMVLWCEGNTFIAGADIREFGKPREEPFILDVVQFIEDSPKPVVAAIHGSALGGGLEVALGCHFRLAAPNTTLGLPEVKLGIIPAAGGTQRLPRLVGAQKALDIIVSGSHIPVFEALAAGLIDDIVEGDLKDAAIAFAERVIIEQRPIRRISTLDVTVDNSNVFAEYAKNIARKQRGFLAPFHCIKAVQAATELPFAEGVKRERELSLEMHASPQSKAQQHVFFAEREVFKIPGLPADTVTRNITRVGVIGAGTMGGGIAMCFANAGIPVSLLEMNQESLDRGMNIIRKNYANTVAKGTLKREEMDNRLGFITPTLSYDQLKNVDMVIEAAFEDMGVKREIFTKLDAVCKPGAILATNTSYLDINAIAAVTTRPEDVIGTHFFSPANVMKLLENVRGEKTSPEVCATAMKMGKVIGKVPVLVGVCDGFVGNRMLSKRTREAYFMLEEGATPRQIDDVLYDFGFPMGPFAMGDLAGLDVGWRNRKAKFDKLTPREQHCNILDKICELGRYGQKTGAGFYQYDGKRSASVDPIVEGLIVEHSQERGLTRRQIGDQEILERCLYAMINEGAKILDEGISARPHDIDVIWVYGYGFPAYHGGPMFYADHIGLETVYKTILKYREQFGDEYWQPSPLLEKLAREGKGFYRN